MKTLNELLVSRQNPAGVCQRRDWLVSLLWAEFVKNVTVQIDYFG